MHRRFIGPELIMDKAGKEMGNKSINRATMARVDQRVEGFEERKNRLDKRTTH